MCMIFQSITILLINHSQVFNDKESYKLTFSLFIVLLSFSESLAKKCLFLNDKPCMVRPILIGMNPVEDKYCPFVISIYRFTGICNVLSSKIYVPKKQNTYMLKHLI